MAILCIHASGILRKMRLNQYGRIMLTSWQNSRQPTLRMHDLVGAEVVLHQYRLSCRPQFLLLHRPLHLSRSFCFWDPKSSVYIVLEHTYTPFTMRKHSVQHSQRTTLIYGAQEVEGTSRGTFQLVAILAKCSRWIGSQSSVSRWLPLPANFENAQSNLFHQSLYYFPSTIPC